MALVQSRSQRRLAPAATGPLIGSHQPAGAGHYAPAANMTRGAARPQNAPQAAEAPPPSKAEQQLAKAQELMAKLNRPDLHEKQPPPKKDKPEKKEGPRLSNHDLKQLMTPNLSRMTGPPAIARNGNPNSQPFQKPSGPHGPQRAAAQQSPQFQPQNRPLAHATSVGNMFSAPSQQLLKNTSLPVVRKNAIPLGAAGSPNRGPGMGGAGSPNLQARFGAPPGQAAGSGAGSLGRRVSLPAGFTGADQIAFGSPPQLPPQLSPHGPPQPSPRNAFPPMKSPVGAGVGGRSPTFPGQEPRGGFGGGGGSGMGAGGSAGGVGGGAGEMRAFRSEHSSSSRSLTRMLESKEIVGDNNPRISGGRCFAEGQLRPEISPRGAADHARDYIETGGSTIGDYEADERDMYGGGEEAEDREGDEWGEARAGALGAIKSPHSPLPPNLSPRTFSPPIPSPGATFSPRCPSPRGGTPQCPSPTPQPFSNSPRNFPPSADGGLPPQRPPRRSGSNLDQLMLKTSLEELQLDPRNCRSLCNSNNSSPSVSRCNSVDCHDDSSSNELLLTGDADIGDGISAASAGLRGKSRLGPSRQGSLVPASVAAAAAAASAISNSGPASTSASAAIAPRVAGGAPQPVALSAAAARKSLQNLRRNPAPGGGGADLSSSAPAGALAAPRMAGAQQQPPAAARSKGVARTQSLDCSNVMGSSQVQSLGRVVLKSRAASVDMAGAASQAAAQASAAGGAAGAGPGNVPKCFSASGAASFSGRAALPVTRVARSLSSLSAELGAPSTAGSSSSKNSSGSGSSSSSSSSSKSNSGSGSSSSSSTSSSSSSSGSAAASANNAISSIAAAAAATAALDDDVCSVDEIRSAFFKSEEGGGKGLLGFAMRGLGKGMFGKGLSQLSGMLGGVGGGFGENVLGREFLAVDKKYLVMMDQELGSGQFGVTRMAKCRQTGKQFACKSICKANLKSKSDVEDIRREVSMLETLRPNPNIARLEDVFEDEEGVHMVMELCVGGELFDKIKEKKRYEEKDAVPVMRTILDVLAFCHMRGIVHRDVKPENVLLTSPDSISECKLIDFGVATVVKPGAKPLSDFVGSPFYVAPEVIEGSYGIPADVWSAGVVLYVLLSGVPPFWARTDAGIMKAIKEAKPCFKGDEWRDVSLEAVDLVRRMLTKDPKKRLTARAALEHSWFSVWND